MADVTASGLRVEFQNALKYGQQIRIRYFNEQRNDKGYDDDVTLTQSGSDLYLSGLHQPFDANKGGTDAFLKEQGRILENVSVMYIDGNITTSGIFRVGLGSPALGTQEYGIVDNGIIGWNIGGEIVYKKLYIQALPAGSLAGE